MRGPLAQMEERLPEKQKVEGSSTSRATQCEHDWRVGKVSKYCAHLCGAIETTGGKVAWGKVKQQGRDPWFHIPSDASVEEVIGGEDGHDNIKQRVITIIIPIKAH